MVCRLVFCAFTLLLPNAASVCHIRTPCSTAAADAALVRLLWQNLPSRSHPRPTTQQADVSGSSACRRNLAHAVFWTVVSKLDTEEAVAFREEWTFLQLPYNYSRTISIMECSPVFQDLLLWSLSNCKTDISVIKSACHPTVCLVCSFQVFVPKKPTEKRNWELTEDIILYI